MTKKDGVQRALFKVEGSTDEIEVHFNPASLQYTVTNTLQEGKGDKKKQYVSQSTGKLNMDLIFDTTGSGEDVREHTIKVAKFMEPQEENAPPLVTFEWGIYTFKGMVDSYKETMDFFSADGVPLRASINLAMSSQDKVFELNKTEGFENDAVPASSLPGQGVTALATIGGNPGAGRLIAEVNGVASMRFTGQASLEISGSVSLKPPSAFASGGIGIGAGGGIGLGIGVGGSAGLSAGAGIGAGVSVGAGMSAGVSASAGAFAGLRAGPATVKSKAKVNVNNFIDKKVTAGFGTDDQSSFGLGGQAGLQGSASLKADVGKAGELKTSIEFDGD